MIAKMCYVLSFGIVVLSFIVIATSHVQLVRENRILRTELQQASERVQGRCPNQ